MLTLTDVESIVRAIRHDAGKRLYNAVTNTGGSTQRAVHNSVLMQHMYFTPFETVKELRDYIVAHVPRNDDEQVGKELLLLQLFICTEQTK